MAFRRRFNRFRRRFPVQKARRPTWQQAWDFQSSVLSGPAQQFASTNPNNDPRAVVSSYSLVGSNSMVLQRAPFGTEPFFQPIIDDSDLNFYEGELSLVRLLGHVRLHRAWLVRDPGVGLTFPLQVEVRATIYKTFEQTQNVITVLQNPFLQADKDMRILWSASWISRLSVYDTTTLMNNDRTQDFELAPPGAGPIFKTAQRVAGVRMKQAVKVKGNERVIMSFAMAPTIPDDPTAIWGIDVSGWGRALIKH